MKISRFNIGFIKAYKEQNGHFPPSELAPGEAAVSAPVAPEVEDRSVEEFFLVDALKSRQEALLSELSQLSEVVEEVAEKSPVMVIPEEKEVVATLPDFELEDEELVSDNSFHPLDRDQDGDIEDDSFDGMAYPIKFDLVEMGEDHAEELARKLGKKHKIGQWHVRKLNTLLRELANVGIVEWNENDPS